MARFKDFVPHGVIPAVLLPFHDDLSIDEPSFRSHLRDVAAVEGLSALTINAHSTEVASCTADEQSRVLEIAGDEVGDRLPLIHGIWADGSLEAARIARRAQAGGASALLVFPPAPFTLGQSPAMAVEHFRRIADDGGLPIIAGGEVIAIFGGYEIDLTEAGMAGDYIEIEAVNIFGGGEIRVPAGWSTLWCRPGRSSSPACSIGTSASRWSSTARWWPAWMRPWKRSTITTARWWSSATASPHFNLWRKR